MAPARRDSAATPSASAPSARSPTYTSATWTYCDVTIHARHRPAATRSSASSRPAAAPDGDDGARARRVARRVAVDGERDAAGARAKRPYDEHLGHDGRHGVADEAHEVDVVADGEDEVVGDAVDPRARLGEGGAVQDRDPLRADRAQTALLAQRVDGAPQPHADLARLSRRNGERVEGVERRDLPGRRRGVQTRVAKHGDRPAREAVPEALIVARRLLDARDRHGAPVGGGDDLVHLAARAAALDDAAVGAQPQVGHAGAAVDEAPAVERARSAEGARVELAQRAHVEPVRAVLLPHERLQVEHRRVRVGAGDERVEGEPRALRAEERERVGQVHEPDLGVAKLGARRAREQPGRAERGEDGVEEKRARWRVVPVARARESLQQGRDEPRLHPSANCVAWVVWRT